MKLSKTAWSKGITKDGYHVRAGRGLWSVADLYRGEQFYVVVGISPDGSTYIGRDISHHGYRCYAPGYTTEPRQ